MTSGQPPQPGQAPIDTATGQAAALLWQMPFLLFTSWWNMATGGCWATPHHPHPRDADAQLVIPEPIEETGEHALFA